MKQNDSSGAYFLTTLVTGIGKSLILWSFIVSYMLVSLTCSVVIRSPKKRLRFFTGLTSKYCRGILKILAISTTVSGDASCLGKKTFFIISNHVSYLDILILSSHQPSAFITSVEIQKTFFMGFLATLGGSLFVERRNKAGLHREIAAMRQTCEHGVPIVLFPEGTSSNGETVLPFKSSLFQSAIEAGIDIIPVCLRYKTIDGRPVTKCNRDRLFYYGSIYFFPHLLQLPFVRCAEVNLTYLDPISVRDGMNRKELAALSFQRIYTAYHHSDQSDAVTVDANL